MLSGPLAGVPCSLKVKRQRDFVESRVVWKAHGSLNTIHKNTEKKNDNNNERDVTEKKKLCHEESITINLKKKKQCCMYGLMLMRR